MKMKYIFHIVIGLLIIISFITNFLCNNAEGASCKEYDLLVKEYYQELQSIRWAPLKPGVQLTNFDAILVCANSNVKMRANHPFYNDYVEWGIDSNKKTLHGTIRDSKMVVLGNNNSHLQLYVDEMIGTAYYSTDKKLLNQTNMFGLDFSADVGKRERALSRNLNSLHWIPAEEKMVLQHWSILKTGNKSSAILRIEKGDTWVTTPELKEEDNLLIIPSNTYLVINPMILRVAVIKKIINQVYISNQLVRIEKELSDIWVFQE